MQKFMQIDFKLFIQGKHVFFKSNMCSLGKLDGKKIISILNQMVARERTHLFILIC